MNFMQEAQCDSAIGTVLENFNSTDFGRIIGLHRENLCFPL